MPARGHGGMRMSPCMAVPFDFLRLTRSALPSAGPGAMLLCFPVDLDTPPERSPGKTRHYCGTFGSRSRNDDDIAIALVCGLRECVSAELQGPRRLPLPCIHPLPPLWQHRKLVVFFFCFRPHRCRPPPPAKMRGSLCIQHILILPQSFCVTARVSHSFPAVIGRHCFFGIPLCACFCAIPAL